MRKAAQRLGVSAALAGAAFLGTAKAEDYCVVCVHPSSMYRCEIEGSPAGRGSDPKAQLRCITELAKRGGHESCLVSKSAPVPCPGLTVVLAPQEAGPSVGEAHPPIRDGGAGTPVTEAPVSGESAAPETPEAATPAPGGAPAIAGAPKNDPAAPKTVQELAGQTVEATKDSISKAGSAVTGTAEKAGNAAKSTWKCISSFFSDC